MTCFVGVDVGLDGGLAILPDGEVPKVVKMPTYEISQAPKAGKKAKKKREVDFQRLRRVFVALTVNYGDVFVMLERPQLRPAMIKDANDNWVPNQGILSQTNFMGQWRELRGLLLGLGIPQEDIHPATWKADVFRGQPSRDKSVARQKAAQLFPAIAAAFKNKNSDGVAEALLLADYARRRRGNPF